MCIRDRTNLKEVRPEFWEKLEQEYSMPKVEKDEQFAFEPVDRMIAVSYTHLDVYKRQGMGGANLLNKAGHEVLGRKQQEGIAPTVSPALLSRLAPPIPINRCV